MEPDDAIAHLLAPYIIKDRDPNDPGYWNDIAGTPEYKQALYHGTILRLFAARLGMSAEDLEAFTQDVRNLTPSPQPPGTV